MTPPITSQSTSGVDNAAHRRGCLFYVTRGLKWFGIVLVALVLLGVVYQAVAVELDKRAYAPRGQLYTVNGHQMHLVCTGVGSPAVILVSRCDCRVVVVEFVFSIKWRSIHRSAPMTVPVWDGANRSMGRAIAITITAELTRSGNTGWYSHAPM